MPRLGTISRHLPRLAETMQKRRPMIPDYWVDPSHSRDWMARERAGEGSSALGLILVLALVVLAVLIFAR